MEIKPISTSLWKPRNLTQSILERKADKTIAEKNPQLNPNYSPTYCPTEKIRTLRNKINYRV